LSNRPTRSQLGQQVRRGFDYTTVGHVTADIRPDGSRHAGGSAFYSALQAARLGLRTLIVTQGEKQDIEALLAPYRDELSLQVRPARETTSLTIAHGRARRQRLLAWAGAIGNDVALDTAILHLAPVARETPSRWRGQADVVALTPQGLVRRWAARGAEIEQVTLAAALLPERCDAIVISEQERDSCAQLIAARASGSDSGEREMAPELLRLRSAVLAVTAAAAATALYLPDGATTRVSVPSIEGNVDDVGAGDVFAAAFFVALSEGRPPRDAAAFANAAAAVRIAGAGPRAIGDRQAIEARLRAVA
jgi:sugar/nucleoside kinase (ribokinase family)